MSDHALLSASSAARWLACTPSARLEETLPDTTSESAKEGTLAHAIAELKLRNMAIEPMPKRTFNSRLRKLQNEELYQKEMDRYTEEYIDYIRSIMLSYPEQPFVQAEVRLDYSNYAPEGFGTADCILISGNTLHIIDFKYGKNVPVIAENNPQLKLYALGAINEYRLMFGISEIHAHIFQPRIYEGETENKTVMRVSELIEWGNSIKPIAEAAFNGEGEQEIGNHCQFCRAKAICRKYADHNFDLVKHEFKLPPLLTHEEVGEILKQAINLESWAKKLKEWALAETLAGAEIPGWKAVEGRSSRSWVDQEQAFNRLIAKGIEECFLYVRTPLTLSQVEREIGKKTFVEFVGDLVVKTPGKPALVEESDKREAITKQSAKEDFSNG